MYSRMPSKIRLKIEFRWRIINRLQNIGAGETLSSATSANGQQTYLTDLISVTPSSATSENGQHTCPLGDLIQAPCTIVKAPLTRHDANRMTADPNTSRNGFPRIILHHLADGQNISSHSVQALRYHYTRGGILRNIGVHGMAVRVCLGIRKIG
jgi:hypothetical protein